jgi:hypothetical protein
MVCLFRPVTVFLPVRYASGHGLMISQDEHLEALATEPAAYEFQSDLSDDDDEYGNGNGNNGDNDELQIVTPGSADGEDDPANASAIAISFASQTEDEGNNSLEAGATVNGVHAKDSKRIIRRPIEIRLRFMPLEESAQYARVDELDDQDEPAPEPNRRELRRRKTRKV